MNEETTLTTNTGVVIEQDKGRCAPAPGSAVLSPEMRRCLATIEGPRYQGVITRFPGGFWVPGVTRAGFCGHFGTTTVEALVKRGTLIYDEWKESHGRRFPTRASMPSV